MKVMVIGSGGREHAMVWKLAQSKNVEKIWAAPGNGGTAGEAKTENFSNDGLDPSSEEGQKALVEFVKTGQIDLTVVGPEVPLAAGISDRFRAAGLAIVGPDKKAARLESSKIYSKSFMEKYGVRTAKSKNFTESAKSLAYAEEYFGGKPNGPMVIKADGLSNLKNIFSDLCVTIQCPYLSTYTISRINSQHHDLIQFSSAICFIRLGSQNGQQTLSFSFPFFTHIYKIMRVKCTKRLQYVVQHR
jgi:hypothetical protein